MKEKAERFMLTKGSKFLELKDSGSIVCAAYKDIEVELIQRKGGLTYFKLGKMTCRLLRLKD